MTSRLSPPLRALVLFVALALASVAGDDRLLAWLAGALWGAK